MSPAIGWAANSVWSFTTGAASNPTPVTVWPSTATPTVLSDADTGSVNLGVKFKSDVAGFVTGVRFYKGTANTGTHVGTLWSSTDNNSPQRLSRAKPHRVGNR